jgi:hypothetical protein
MSDASTTTLGLSRVLLQILRVLNIVVAAGFFCLLVASFFAADAFEQYYRTHIPKADVERLLPALRAMVIVGAPMFALIHVILGRILEMIETVRQGDPFVPENAARLRTVAWCLLIIQLLGFGFAILALQVRAANVDMEFSNSLSGWLAVLLTFVLAGVFEHGARLRSDLQAMI